MREIAVSLRESWGESLKMLTQRKQTAIFLLLLRTCNICVRGEVARRVHVYFIVVVSKICK